MYAKTTIIGSIKSFEKTKNGTGQIVMSISRPYPDHQNNYLKDLINVSVWSEHFKQIEPYLFYGQMLLVEGRIESKLDVENSPSNYVQAERIEKLTFK